MSDFEDIEIVDLDVKKTTWSRVHTAMRSVYLRLTREPDVQWARFFHEERNSRINVRRHGLWIEDDYIVLDCFLDEVEPHHLPDVNRSIAFANRKSRELEASRRDEKIVAKTAVVTEQDALAALRERIRGGASAKKPDAAPHDPAHDLASAVTAPDLAVAPVAATTPFDAKRDDLRARFRAAMAATKEKKGA